MFILFFLILFIHYLQLPIYINICLYFILLIVYEIMQNENNYKHSLYPIEVKKSNISGLGVFATRNIKKGEIIEECPCIEDDIYNFKGKINDYVFTSDNNKKNVVALGYCSIYNHQDNYDAKWIVKNGKHMTLIALKDIPKGKEIYNNYGEDYWKSRKKQKIIK